MKNRNEKMSQVVSVRQHWEESGDLYNSEASRKVFVNIPYSEAYYQLEVALCTTLIAFDLIPILGKHAYDERMLLENLLHLISICGYGVSDLSDTGRMNMPFEHGIILGMKPMERACVLVTSAKTIQDHFSDIQGLVLREHGGSPSRLVGEFAEWLRVNARQDISDVRLGIRTDSIVRTLPAVEKLLEQYNSYAMVATHYDQLWLEACLSEEMRNFGQAGLG